VRESEYGGFAQDAFARELLMLRDVARDLAEGHSLTIAQLGTRVA
jgi:hypothetical protein